MRGPGRLGWRAANNPHEVRAQGRVRTRVPKRRSFAPSVFVAHGQRVFEGAAGKRANGARLPTGTQALQDTRGA